MIVFNRKAGTLTFSDGHVEHGIWSGHGDAANDPSREREKMIGPLPAGDYKIGPPRQDGHLGPFVMNLDQISGESYGRGDFRNHGDVANDTTHSASDGCVISGYSVRVRVNQDADRLLRVV